jgi:hypothetical protein
MEGKAKRLIAATLAGATLVAAGGYEIATARGAGGSDGSTASLRMTDASRHGPMRAPGRCEMDHEMRRIHSRVMRDPAMRQMHREAMRHPAMRDMHRMMVR